MTYHTYIGLGAQIVEQTLKTLVQHKNKTHVSAAIIAALRHLRRVVGFTQGEVGLRRFDSDLLYLFNKYRSGPENLALDLVQATSPMSTSSDPKRIKAILIDAVENCLLLNAQGQLTSTDVLVDLLTSTLIALDGKEASLGDLLLDVSNYRNFSRPFVLQTISFH